MNDQFVCTVWQHHFWVPMSENFPPPQADCPPATREYGDTLGPVGRPVGEKSVSPVPDIRPFSRQKCIPTWYHAAWIQANESNQRTDFSPLQSRIRINLLRITSMAGLGTYEAKIYG